MSSRVIFVLQEKGGTRKTWIAAHLADYMRKHGVAHSLYEADSSPGHLLTLFPDTAIPLEFEDLSASGNGDERRGLGEIVAATSEGKNVIVDFGANCAKGFYDFFAVKLDYPEELKRVGARATIICPVTGDPKSAQFFAMFKQVFPWATILLARVLPPRGPMPATPDHPADLSFDVPAVSPVILSHYLTQAMTLERISAAGDSHAHGVPYENGAFARGSLRQLYSNFDRVQQHILP